MENKESIVVDSSSSGCTTAGCLYKPSSSGNSFVSTKRIANTINISKSSRSSFDSDIDSNQSDNRRQLKKKKR